MVGLKQLEIPGHLGAGTVLKWKRYRNFASQGRQTISQNFGMMGLCTPAMKHPQCWRMCVCVLQKNSSGVNAVYFQNLVVPWLAHCGDKVCNAMSYFLITIKTKPIWKVSSDVLWGLLWLLAVLFGGGKIWDSWATQNIRAVMISDDNDKEEQIYICLNLFRAPSIFTFSCRWLIWQFWNIS